MYATFVFKVRSSNFLPLPIPFSQLNGLSNRFWGWGREDDELYMRIQEANLKVSTLSQSDSNAGVNTVLCVCTGHLDSLGPVASPMQLLD